MVRIILESILFVAPKKGGFMRKFMHNWTLNMYLYIMITVVVSNTSCPLSVSVSMHLDSKTFYAITLYSQTDYESLSMWLEPDWLFHSLCIGGWYFCVLRTLDVHTSYDVHVLLWDQRKTQSHLPAYEGRGCQLRFWLLWKPSEWTQVYQPGEKELDRLLSLPWEETWRQSLTGYEEPVCNLTYMSRRIHKTSFFTY